MTTINSFKRLYSICKMKKMKARAPKIVIDSADDGRDMSINTINMKEESSKIMWPAGERQDQSTYG